MVSCGVFKPLTRPVGCVNRNQGVKALHLVTAWASEQRLVLGQVKVEDHSNEITAIPALLGMRIK